MAKRSSRRDFLKGKSAADAVSGAGQARWDAADRAARELAARRQGAGRSVDDGRGPLRINEETAGAPATTGAGMHRVGPRRYRLEVSRRAMACVFEVFLNADSSDGSATEHALSALDLVEQLEDQLTVYRRHSEVSQLNGLAARRAVTVEQQLFSLLQRGVELFAETEGAFDLTAGPLIGFWSELRRECQWPADEAVRGVLQRVGSQHLELDPARLAVRFQRPGLSINLGGIGKGYALDRCAKLLHQQGVSDFLMHGGSSSIVARGHQAGSPHAGWTVGVRDPLREDRRLLELQVVDRAVGTSGAGTKQFYYRGKRFGHVLDPRTGYPAEGVISATVVTPFATESDALSTAFYVLGPERTEAYCRQHPHVAALLTTAGKQRGQLEIHAINCGGLEWTRCD